MFDIPDPIWPAVVAAIILLVTALFAWFAALLIAGFMRQSNPRVTAAAQRVGAILVWLVGTVIAVQEVGVGVDILLLVIALLGGAAIVALRQPLENFGAKYFADVYSPFKIGDTIRVGEQSGKVIEINAMTTVLLSEQDQLIALPNSVFLREPVVNLTPLAWKELSVSITLPGTVDLAWFESEMRKSLSKIRVRLDRRYPPVFTTQARSPQSTDLQLTVMVRRPEDRDPVLAEVNSRVTEALSKGRSSSAPATGVVAEASH